MSHEIDLSYGGPVRIVQASYVCSKLTCQLFYFGIAIGAIVEEENGRIRFQERM